METKLRDAQRRWEGLMVVLLSLVCIAAAAPWDSHEVKYVDNHGRIVEVEYKRVPWFGKIPAAGAGAGVAAVRAATAVGGLVNQPGRFVLDLDDDDYIVRSGGNFGVGTPLLKAARPDGTNVYVDYSGEVLYTLDDKNNIVPLNANHPLLKSAAPGEQQFLWKQSVEMLDGSSVEVVYSPTTNAKVPGAPGASGTGGGVYVAK